MPRLHRPLFCIESLLDNLPLFWVMGNDFGFPLVVIHGYNIILSPCMHHCCGIIIHFLLRNIGTLLPWLQRILRNGSRRGLM